MYYCNRQLNNVEYTIFLLRHPNLRKESRDFFLISGENNLESVITGNISVRLQQMGNVVVRNAGII